MRFAPIALVILTCLLLAAHVAAAACSGTDAVGKRTLRLADGREVVVWYPAIPQAEQSARGRHDHEPIDDAPIANCPVRWPVVLFSHGVAGCSEQAPYITEEVARHGYVVAAPNHRDAICGVVLRQKFPDGAGSTRPSFLDPGAWTSDAWRDRDTDLRQALALLRSDPAFAARVDTDRVALMGHSLGGYTVLGAVGGWPDWRIPGVRAVLAFAPFTQPLLAHRRLHDLQVPVMYQVAAWDFGITPAVVAAEGAFATSPKPRYLVEWGQAGHLLWTDLPCRAYRTSRDCLAAAPAARQVDAYAIAFLDRYVKGLAAPLLDGGGAGLLTYRAQR